MTDLAQTLLQHELIFGIEFERPQDNPRVITGDLLDGFGQARDRVFRLIPALIEVGDARIRIDLIGPRFDKPRQRGQSLEGK